MSDDDFNANAAARSVLRRAGSGALATSGKDAHPFASLVTTATTMAGEPVLLLSRIAVHTQNLTRDDRASLLLVAPGGEGGDPLAGARLTVVGRVTADDAPELRARFLARHPEAAGYADFGDFAFHRLTVDHAHLVAGFGRIVDIPAADLLLDPDAVAALAASEAGAIGHMNEDHLDAIRLYATKLAGEPDADWRMSDFDPEGMTLVSPAGAVRVPFPRPPASPGELRQTLVEMARQAREAA